MTVASPPPLFDLDNREHVAHIVGDAMQYGRMFAGAGCPSAIDTLVALGQELFTRTQEPCTRPYPAVPIERVDEYRMLWVGAFVSSAKKG